MAQGHPRGGVLGSVEGGYDFGWVGVFGGHWDAGGEHGGLFGGGVVGYFDWVVHVALSVGDLGARAADGPAVRHFDGVFAGGAVSFKDLFKRNVAGAGGGEN